jgi:hypothetical protein
MPGEATCVWVNPFRCRVDPLMHAELQAAVERRVARGALPDEALSALGVTAPASAVVYLSPQQRDAARQMLLDMEVTFEFEVTAWLLDDALRRARRANMRWQ